MTRRLPQSTAYTVVFKVFLSSDHVTPATTKTVAITLSKNGGAFGNPAAGASNATEISGGWYSFALGTGDTGTLGDLVLTGTATACDSADIVMMVVSATNGGLTNLDAAVSSRAVAGDAMALTSAERIADADVLLDRNLATGTDSGSPSVRTVRQALRFLRNKWSISAGTLTVTKEDDTTSSWTAAITTTAGNPVSGSDPA